MSEEQANPVGRPSSFTQEIADTICSRIIEGESVRTICESEEIPHISTVMRWLAVNKEFREQYARAKELQAEYFAEEILDISDDGTNDWMTRENKDGSEYEVVNSEVLQRSRLRVDTRKWLMGKLAPKKYGDSATLKVGGDPDGVPVQSSIAVTFVRTNATDQG